MACSGAALDRDQVGEIRCIRRQTVAYGGGANAGQRLDPVEKARVKRVNLLPVGVPLSDQRHPHRQRSLRVDAESTLCNRQKLLTNSPAPISSMTARASSDITSRLRHRRLPRLSVALREASLRASLGLSRELCQAGARPKIKLESSDTRAVQPSMLASRSEEH